MTHVDETTGPDQSRDVVVKVHCISAGDPYSCEEALRRLNDYLDHELSPDERVVVLKHLEICKSCFSRFSFEQSLLVCLREKLTGLRAPDTLRVKLHLLLRKH